MRNNFVSIVMPAFNSGKYIKESIDSVLNQSYPSFELIIVDDFSSDNTIDMINFFEDERIVLLQNRYQKGAAGARRTGLEYAQGRYIAFLDSDDLWPKEKLRLHVNYMLKHEVSFTYSDYYSFRYNIDKPIKYHRVDPELTYSHLLKTCQIGCLTVVFDQSKFYDLKYENVPKEDYAFWLKLLKQCKKGYRVTDSYAFYRLNSKSLSSNKLQEIKKQWYIIHCIEKKSLICSAYYMITYTLNGIKKHYL